jgi:outer membrane protein OmpA-like peptidoglycan-associated protein
MKTLSSIALIMLLFHSLVFSQETSKKRMPLMVSHLSEENKALLRRKAAPKHNILTRVICFNRVCRGFIGWRKNQRSMRFKGYKDGGKIPKAFQRPAPKNDTTIIRTKIAEPLIEAQDTIPEIVQKLFVLDEVLFALNRSDLNNKFIYRLDSLIGLMKDNKNIHLNISGHTDNTGSESFNLKLSKDRAAAVAKYLNQKIHHSKITFDGFGSSKPVAPNDTPEGRRKNRRVEILLSEQ